ncbi:anaerobic sulfatase maturase [Vibrio aquaticus]|nr:anaerobic sulfatase maturase [Vibrio aquaticus]
MAKPSGSICNIDCEYCFYLEKDKLYPERNAHWKMSDETLVQYIKQQIDAQPGNQVDFAWQGGEPTLLGLDFYRRVVELCEEFKQAKTITHSFQTNGLLIDEEWCHFFKQNNFLIGLSIDGPKEAHDYYRVTRSKKPTHEKVVAAAKLLKSYGIKFNTLTVVNDKNVKQPKQVYQFLKELGSTHLQFIPIVERLDNQPLSDRITLAGPDQDHEVMAPWSVKPKEYGQFLTDIFDQWVEQDVGTIFVQTFDSTLASWLGQPAGVCLFAKECGHSFALEANGDLYQCDHYVYPEYKLGNIHIQDISSMNNSARAIKFGKDKSTNLNSDCKQCRYKFACFGGCPKHRFSHSPNGLPHHNYLCSGYHHYFTHTESAMKIMAFLVNQQRPASEIMTFMRQKNQRSEGDITSKSIGRNSPCSCGSGRKSKKCCHSN